MENFIVKGISISKNIYELYKIGYVFLGIINIIIACLNLKKVEKRKIRNILIISIVITIVGFFISQIYTLRSSLNATSIHENIYLFIIRIINYIIQIVIFIKLIINIKNDKQKD